MDDSKFAEECLNQHNALRAKHNAPKLELDPELSEFAQEWAVALAAKGALEPRDRSEGDHGENLYVGEVDSEDWSGAAKRAVDDWYAEVSKVEFKRDAEGAPENFEEIQRFGQLVWKGSDKLGVGAATGEDGKLYVVCNYSPPGNQPKDEFYNNVEPPEGYVYEDDEDAPQEDQDEDIKDAKKSPEPTIRSSKSIGSSKTLKTISKKSDKLVHSNLASTAASSTWLSPSLEMRLKSIPPEEVRLWSAWLINVSEQAIKEWHEWLLDHIDLYLRMNSYLLKAKRDIEKREQRVNFSKIVVAKSASTVVSLSTVISEQYPKGKRFCEELARKSETSLMKRRRLGCCRPDDPVEEVSNDGFTTRYQGFEEYFGDEGFEDECSYYTETIETSSSSTSCPDLETIRRRLCEKIPIPMNECEMWQLMEDIRRQARRYQLLYDHWFQICQKVQMKINSKVESSTEVQDDPDEMESYFAFLRDEMDFEPRYESELGGYINAEGRERITCRHLQLFFNLKEETPVCRPCTR